MSAIPLSKVVRHLRGVLGARATTGLAETDLWERYVLTRDELAFEGLLCKHGPMVLGVCRRILRQEQDAEDAFQATFLVLVRKAASLRSPQTLSNWLYGVARRTALEARTTASRRRAREAVLPSRLRTSDEPDDLRPVLDEELGRLPDRYRVAVVLCDLEGLTRKEAAGQLGWAEGTVASRLARGRSLLAKRLARRGFAGALASAALASSAAPACVPASLLRSTLSSLAGARGMLSASVAALTEGVLRTMFMTKLKAAAAVVLALLVATLGTGALISGGRATEPVDAPAKNPRQANPADLHRRVLELKLQVQNIQRELVRLEEDSQPQPELRKSGSLVDGRFKYRVPFELGSVESKEGGRIEILEVWGTRPRIEVGGLYVVRGKYVLPPGQRGKLHFYVTATGAWGQGPTPTMDLQTVDLNREKGEFTLLHGMGGTGYFHLYLADPDRYSRMFANVYFGTGDNVLRKLPWKTSTSAGSTGR
jgi:RNA polymerase sigma factor (sigma-70 family)